MCNPRRIHVQATRKIAEAWRAEIEQAHTERRDLSSEARLVQSIAELLPPTARLPFEQAMQVSPEWVWTDGEYRKPVLGGHTAYRPDTGELEIVVQLTDAIEAVGTATLVATGEVKDEVTTGVEFIVYDDDTVGKQKSATKKARAAAEAEADAAATRRAEGLKLEAQELARQSLIERSGEAVEQARRSAEQQLTRLGDKRLHELQLEAAEQLDAVQNETLKGIFQLVAAGLSKAMQAYAAEHGENVQVSEEDGLIEIQFELER
jgi:hypothetical protein